MIRRPLSEVFALLADIQEAERLPRRAVVRMEGPSGANRGRHALARCGEARPWMLVPHREHRDRAGAADMTGYGLQHPAVLGTPELRDRANA